jgi:putative glutathione S-transferase
MASFSVEPTAFDLDNTDLYLYVNAACPFATRALTLRNLSPLLRSKVKVCFVSPLRNENGLEFLCEENRAAVAHFTKLPVTVDSSPINARYLKDIYSHADKNYSGDIATPTLYDAKTNAILHTDSFNLMRAFVATVPNELSHIYQNPEDQDKQGRHLEAELCKMVYSCGFAQTQETYGEASSRIFAELDRLESILSDGRPRILGGKSLSLVDIQLVNTLVRFDPVYFDLFKCFRRRIRSYPFLSNYARSVATKLGDNLPLDLLQIVTHYWTNFPSCNPNGVIPLAYRDDFLEGGIEKYRDDDLIVVEEGGVSGGDEQDQTNKKEQLARGEFVRGVSAHRNWLGDEQFPLEENRYILFVANNCPW